MVRLVRDHVRPHVGRLALAVLCMAFAAGSTAALAYLMEPVLDQIFLEKDRTLLIVVPIAVIGITLIRGAATYGQAVLMAFVGQRVIADLQSRIFAHILRFDLAFFQDTASGRLVSRLTNDVNMMRNAVSNALTGVVKDTLTLLFLVGVDVREGLEARLDCLRRLSHRDLPDHEDRPAHAPGLDVGAHGAGSLHRAAQRDVSGRTPRQGIQPGRLRNPRAPTA